MALSRKSALILAGSGVVLLTLLLRWNSLTSPFERDEGEYAYSARLLLSGHVPYQESFLQKPPPIVFTYALGQIFFPRALWPPRVLAALFAIGTSLLVGYIAWKTYGRGVGLVAMGLAPPMLAFPYIAALAANTEVFMLLPLVGVVAIYTNSRKQSAGSPLPAGGHPLPTWWGEGRERGSSWFLPSFIGKRYFATGRTPGSSWSLAAGFLAALAVLYKPIAVLPLAFLFLVWWWETRSWRLVIQVLLGGVLGSAVVSSCFVLRGGWASFWEEAVVFNGYYTAWWGFGLGNLWMRLEVFLAHWWFLFLFLGWFVWRRPQGWWRWLGLLLASLLAVYQSSIGHYYLLLMPFWAVMAGWSVLDLSGLAARRLGPWARPGVIAVTFLLLFLPIREQLAKSPENLCTWIYGGDKPFRESPLVAEKLAAATKPGDKVFIAGSEPQLLYYARRESVSRFVITYPLIINTPRRLDYQQEVVAALSATPPAAVVVSLRTDSGLWNDESPRVFIDFLQGMVDRDYQLLGGYVWRAGGGQWQELLSPEDMRNASLLLYVRKLTLEPAVAR